MYKILTEAGLVSPKKRRKRKSHHRRKRKARRGTLIQMDATPYEWFSTAEKSTLHCAIATSDEDYQYSCFSLLERYQKAKDGLKKIFDKKLEGHAKRESMQGFIRELELRDTLVDQFDEGLWMATVDAVVVYSEHEATFRLRHGMDWKI